MLHVKTDEIYGRNEITNVNDQRTHVLNIDSRFRESHLEPSSDFLYRFSHVYKNVIHARVASVEIPNGYYHFSKSRKNTMFRLDATDYTGATHHVTVEISDGDYTPECLISAIQHAFDGIRDTYGLFFRIVYNPVSRRTTIIHDGSAPPPCPVGPTHCPVTFGVTFMMLGLEDRPYDFGLGSYLGFMHPFYVVDSPYELCSESLVDTVGDHYFLLWIDDWYTVDHKTNETIIQCLAKILVKRSATGVIFDDGYTVLSNTITFPRPMDISKVRVRLTDKYGVPIDLHNMNVSLSLEVVEVTNVQLYDSYRNYLWTKKEPRPVTHTQGSATSLSGRLFN